MPDVTPEDALQVAQRALAKVNELEREIERLEDERDEMVGDLTALQLRLSEVDDERPYRDLSTDEKVGMVREHAFEKANQGSGKAALDYDDIMWEVFEGNPSADHCYKLMRLAAEAEGFEHQTPSGGNQRLVVDVQTAKRGQAFSSANNRSEGVGR